ncbi:MAG TPA: type I secretion system permease/ATPase [Caulobacteraceae bacterium]|nr:type I secretion system permease/ATPase [Caulobacteraceae bacterium]
MTGPAQISTGSVAFSIAASICGVPVDAAELAHRFGAGGAFGVPEMLRAAPALGLRARSATPSVRRLAQMPMPALARDRSGEFFVIGRIGVDDDGVARQYLIQRPGLAPMALAPEAFAQVWDGSLVLMARRIAPGDPNRPFGLSWFYDAVFRYRRILGEVLMVSFALQLLGLATPLFFQVIVDKVLVHHGLSTLNVVAIGLGIALTFEVLLGGLRSYVFSHTTNRIDVELGARLFHHLLRLPLGYFGARRVGDSVARVRELENIRQFLTGSTLTLVLDLIFGMIFLTVIFLYSPILGWVVTAGIPIYVAISVLATPAIRLRIQEKFRRGAENQSFLVETVSGIETLKAMAVEPQMQRRWEEQLAGYVRSAFRVSTLGILAGQGAQFVSRMTTLVILYVGANQVMHEKMTIGELIAVNMLAGQLSGPILRLAQLWQDFQQVRVSVERVGDILNSAAEPLSPPGAAARPAIEGAIAFDDVSFRYQPTGPRVLDELALSIPAGQIIGVVGPSGSGKSTLTRMVQRLCAPESGRVTIDGLDLTIVDVAWLRRQIGVVLQESVLFNATIRDNIALRDPTMTMDRVVRAARLAGAEEFIAELPGGYETAVGERGSTLSGGQRQRIAIARALALDPRILIFDEATSALDPESEQAIQANMLEICRGRTVVIVAHRLSALRNVHRIVTLERGRIIEDGTHAELLRAGGRYAHLWAAQTQGLTTVAAWPGAAE